MEARLSPTRRIFDIDKNDIAVILISLVALFIFIPVFTYAYFAKDLESKDGIMNKNDTGVTLFDRGDRPFFTFYEAKNKTFVSLDKIPPHTQRAIIAVEDKDFYYHRGFSVKAILRSLLSDIKEKDVVYGGSTITQQLVKNALLTPKKSFLRKYQEIVLAQEIERRFSKKEILEMYLNSVYFGEGAFGIEEAAQVYFGKHAAELSLAESALLVGLLPSPSSLSPLSNDRTVAKQRQLIVLEEMREQEYLTSQEKAQAEIQQLVYVSSPNSLNKVAPHFAIQVRNELIEQFGEEVISRSGFKVYTTLDLDWQMYAQDVVRNQVGLLVRNQATNGSAVAIDPKNGEVRVWVGSYAWENDSFGKVDIPTSLRQPGSSFKPIVYSAGFEQHVITPATIIKDEPTVFRYDGQSYLPQNYDKKFRGPVTVRKALANSLNVPSVAIMEKVGVSNALAMSRRLGLTTLTDSSNYGLSLVLGAGEVKLVELTNAYAVFANGGKENKITTITKITDKTGRDVYTMKKEEREMLDPGIAFLISSILSDNKARREVFGNALTLSRPAAAKTGTTENYRDAWTFGYTPSLVVGVWVGNNDGKPMDQVAGSLGAAPIWRQLMEHFLRKTPVEAFRPPSNIRTMVACGVTNTKIGDRTVATSSAYQEFFLAGTEPQRPCLTPMFSPTRSITPSPAVIGPASPTLSPPTPSHRGKEKKEDKGNRKNTLISLPLA